MTQSANIVVSRTLPLLAKLNGRQPDKHVCIDVERNPLNAPALPGVSALPASTPALRSRSVLRYFAASRATLGPLCLETFVSAEDDHMVERAIAVTSKALRRHGFTLDVLAPSSPPPFPLQPLQAPTMQGREHKRRRA